MQVRKLFFVALQCKLRFLKVQLRSLHFKILDTTFMTGFGMMKFIYIGSYSVVVKSIAWQSEGLGENLANLRICQNKKTSYLIKLWLRALRFKFF